MLGHQPELANRLAPTTLQLVYQRGIVEPLCAPPHMGPSFRGRVVVRWG